MQNKGTPFNFDLQDLNSTPYNNDLISNITFMFRMHRVQQQMQQTSECYQAASTSKDRQVSERII